MEEKTENLNIYQKLAKIRKPAEVLAKNKKGYGYTYVSEDEILSKITGLMDKYEVSLVPIILPSTTKVEPYHYTTTKTTKDGKVYESQSNDILVSCEMEWHWVNNNNPDDRIIIPWVLIGQQADASQAFGSGLTYSSRYFLLKYFNIATPDSDPDHWRSKQLEAKKFEDKEISKEIIAQVHKKVTSHLEACNQDKTEREKMIKTVEKYEKSGNYMLITNPEVAAKLLEDITALTEKKNAKAVTKTQSKTEAKKTTTAN